MSLPSGYAQLAYIKSSGAQYIDTGVAAAKDLKVEAIMDVDESSAWIMILGDYTSSKYFSWWAKANLAYAYFGSKSGTLTFSAGKHTYIADGPNNKWEIDGTSITLEPASSDFSGAGGTLYLFSVHNGGSYASASAKLYSCKIYKNKTLIRDFVPCRNASGTLGLYDLTNNRFYENAGSGDFEGPYYGALKNSCLIDGATYQIKNGKVLIGGTKYEINTGNTLIDGTTKEIKIKQGPVLVQLTGHMRENIAQAAYDGTVHTTHATIEVTSGTPVIIKVGSTRGGYNKSTVSINGVVVFTGDRQEYSYYPKANATINFVEHSYFIQGRGGYYYSAEITEG